MKKHLLCAVAVSTAILGLSGVSAHAQAVTDNPSAQTVSVAPAAPAASPAPTPRPSFLNSGSGVTFFAGYSYLDNGFTQGNDGAGNCGLCDGRSATGGIEIQGTYWLNPNVGLTADFSGNSGLPTRSDPDGDGSAVRLNQDSWYVLFGPSVQKSIGKVNLFAHALVGLARLGASEDDSDCAGCGFYRYATIPLRTGFSMGIGGGADWMFSRHIGWRIVQVDYLWSDNPTYPCDTCSESVNNARLSTGIVINLGGTK